MLGTGDPQGGLVSTSSPRLSRLPLRPGLWDDSRAFPPRVAPLCSGASPKR